MLINIYHKKCIIIKYNVFYKIELVSIFIPLKLLIIIIKILSLYGHIYSFRNHLIRN